MTFRLMRAACAPIVAIASLLVPTPAPAQGTITPVLDLNQGPNIQAIGSLGAGAVHFDGRTLFVVTTPTLGSELWTTDGTAAGTRLFADICPGRCSGSPGTFHVESSRLFFAANDGRHGNELWMLAAGSDTPVLVADIEPGAISSSPRILARASWRASGIVVTRTLLAATRRDVGRELFRLVPTTGVVTLEADVIPGPSGGEPLSVATLDTLELAVLARSPTAFRDVRVLTYTSSTGGASGSTALPGLTVPTGRFIDSPLVALGGSVYLRIDGGAGNDELWVTGGTAATTSIIASAPAVSAPVPNAALNRAFFTIGGRLHVAQGSVVTALAPTTVRNLTSIGSRVMFTADAGGSLGRELMKSDGTAAGTVLVASLVPGTGGVPLDALSTRAGGGTHLLVAFDDQLWASNGEAAGTFEVGGSVIAGAGEITVLAPTGDATTLVGFAVAGAAGGEPFATRGTVGSTVALGNFHPDVGDSFALPAGAIGDRVLFEAFVPSAPEETRFSTSIASPGAIEPMVGGLLVPSGVHFGRLWYRGLDGLVTTDGTAAGTTVIDTVRPEIRGPECVISRGAERYFLGVSTNPNAVDIWRSDGTAAGTVPVTSIGTLDDSCFGGRRQIAGFGDRIVFTAYTDATDFEPYVLDGAGNATLLADIRAGDQTSLSHDFTALDTRAVFAADDGIAGEEPWVTNGTGQGTLLLADLAPGAASSAPMQAVRAGALVFFSATTPAGGRELHVSDGTPAGTRRVVDLFAGTGSALVENSPSFAAFGHRIWFAATGTADPGCVLYESDGTAAGTRCAYDSSAVTLGPVGDIAITPAGVVVFTAARFAPDDGEEVRALFNRRLLTIAGGDIAAGPAGSAPNRFVVSGRDVFFQADDGATGRELWRLRLADLDAVFANGFE